MMVACRFSPANGERYSVELGVLDSRGVMCVAEVCLLNGAFVIAKGNGAGYHVTEPGPAFSAQVNFHNWSNPPLLYFKSREDRKRYVDNRVEALRVLAHAKYK
jgi:hypothetical protein